MAEAHKWQKTVRDRTEAETLSLLPGFQKRQIGVKMVEMLRVAAAGGLRRVA